MPILNLELQEWDRARREAEARSEEEAKQADGVKTGFLEAWHDLMILVLNLRKVEVLTKNASLRLLVGFYIHQAL